LNTESEEPAHGPNFFGKVTFRRILETNLSKTWKKSNFSKNSWCSKIFVCDSYFKF